MAMGDKSSNCRVRAVSVPCPCRVHAVSVLCHSSKNMSRAVSVLYRFLEGMQHTVPEKKLL